MKTARDLIQQAAKKAGVIDAIEALESLEASDALQELNDIIDGWNIDALFPYVNEEYNVPNPTLEPGKVKIGPATEGSVDVDAARPNRVISVAINKSGRYYPLEYVSPADAATSNFRNTGAYVGGIPIYYTVHTTFPIAEIEIFPAVDAFPYIITTQNVVSAKTLNDTIDLPAGYYPALVAELAVVLAGDYGNMEMIPLLQDRAAKTLARLKRLNNKPRRLSHDGTPRGSGYWDITSDNYL